MKHKRALCAAAAAFVLTVAVVGTVAALLLVDVRVGSTLFGDRYATATYDGAVSEKGEDTFSFPWLPARLQVLFKIPDWEAQLLEWLLSRRG